MVGTKTRKRTSFRHLFTTAFIVILALQQTMFFVFAENKADKETQLQVTEQKEAVITEEDSLAEEGEPAAKISDEDAGTGMDLSIPSSKDGEKSSLEEAAPAENDAADIVLKEETLTAEGRDYNIKIRGLVPEGSRLDVKEIEQKKKLDALGKEASEKIFEKDSLCDGGNPAYARFFDITILDKEGNEYEPEEKVSLTIDLKDNTLAAEDVDITAVHFDDKGNAELLPISIDNSIATLEAESFSVYGIVCTYTVDFYYTSGKTNTEYHMNGGSEMMMSDLFDSLGIDHKTKDIKSVEFTDESLVSFKKEGNDYRIKSLKPFTTGEQLTISFKDSTSITILVEDATYKWWFGGGGISGRSSDIYAELDTETGKLIIRPKDTCGGASGSAAFEGSYVTKGDWKWDQYRNYIKEVEFQGTISASPNYFINLNYMFADCPNLTKVTGIENFDTTNIHALARMFSGCTKLTTVDISSFKSDSSMQNMQNMFRDSGVVTVNMPGEDFKVADDAFLTGMFQDCKSLTTVIFNGMDVTGAKSLKDMFNGCTSLKSLDVSGFGTLEKIVSMDGFVKGCTSLETLDISRLNNSHIKPQRKHHPQSGTSEGLDWGHDLGINPESTPKLKMLIADHSRVYMCKNNTGSPDNQPFNAAYTDSLMYFTDKQADFTLSDGVAKDGVTVKIETPRDYIDLITDRREDGARGKDGHTEKTTNKMYGLNTGGAGFLAPGTYKIGDKDRTDPKPDNIPATRYRITDMGKSGENKPVVDLLDETHLRKVVDGDKIYIQTKEKERSSWGSEYVIGDGTNPIIRITYPKVASDFYGNKHDAVIEIKAITFKDLGNIPKPGDEGSERTHNSNKYADGSYYRTVLMAENGNLEFRNYVYSENAKSYETGSWQSAGEQRVLSNGSGTYIDFDIRIKDAPERSTLLFYIDDLDVPHAQKWNNDDSDMCFDYLPWSEEKGGERYGVTYGDGSEGMVLGDGNNLDTITFGAHTGLQMIKSKPSAERNDYVVATGSDPSTSWSEFYVQALATGASYTWTSGIGCDTYLLKNTAPPKKPEDAVLKDLKAEKVLKGRPWRESDKFDVAIVVPPGDTATPLPADAQTIETDDLHYHYVTVGNDDRVEGDPEDSRRRQKSLGDITYTIEDLTDSQGRILPEKTFEYTIQELSPEEGVSSRIDAVTYSNEEYKAYVKVVIDDVSEPDNPKIKVESVTYKKNGETAAIARFTNTYDAGETTDHLAAVKDFHDVNEDKAVSLKGGEFEFAIRPIGKNAAIAPMPKDTTGEGAGRIYKAGNIDTGEVLFKDREAESDGLVFNYRALLEAGISDAALHSDQGVSFEYEMYEVIPEAGEHETKVNNGNSTWSIINEQTGVTTVYDGIHHTRKITVRVNSSEVLYIEDHADDVTTDYYIDIDNTKKPVSELEGYNPNMHHVHPDGDPIFVNYRFQQKYADIKVKKEWNDKRDRDGIRPSSVQAVITNDAAEPLDETLTLKGLFWSVTIKDQPVYKFDVMQEEAEEGIHSKLTKISYTLEEKMDGVINGDENTGYAPGYDFDSPFTLDEEESEKVLTITNTHVPEDMYLVTYLDGDHGKSDGGSDIKKYGDKPQKNRVVPDNGWEFTGEYTYVITNKSGHVIEEGTTTDPQAMDVIGNTVFTPQYKEIIYTVIFENGEHGKSDGGTQDKKYGETPQDNTVTPDNGYTFTGKYNYVIKDKTGKTIDSGTTEDPKSIKVTGDIIFVPIYEKIPDPVAPVDPDDPDDPSAPDDTDDDDTSDQTNPHKDKTKQETDSSTASNSGVKTGDPNSLSAIVAIAGLGIALPLLVITVIRRRRKNTAK